MNDEGNSKMEKGQNIYDALEEEIMKSEAPDREKNRQLSKLLKARGQKINLMLVGATGAGKSSTINAIFDMGLAEVGMGIDPETKDIGCYKLENLTIWDSPGLGDDAGQDKQHARQITEKLSEVDSDGIPVIDLVMVVIDGSGRDLSAAYRLINEVIVPAITKDNAHRILVAVNQSDLAMKGAHWDRENNCPDEVLKAFLEKKCDSVKRRIFEGTGLSITPVYYCAGYTDGDGERSRPYNLTKLLYHIVLSLPAEKRLAIAENLNSDESMWQCDDAGMDYAQGIAESFGETVWGTAGEYAENGAVACGLVFGIPGAIAGGIVCGAAGIVAGVFKGLFGR